MNNLHFSGSALTEYQKHQQGSFTENDTKVFEELSKNKNLSLVPSQIERILDEGGVTFNSYKSKDNQSRPWTLDPLPKVFPEKKWTQLEKNLQQRIKVWNLFLKDIYGSQEILKDKIIPDETIYSNPAYLRACQGLHDDQKNLLLNYSADIVENESGQFIVTGDKAQSPFGIGYALENRLTLNQVYEKEIKNCKVKRLASYFKNLSSSIYEAGCELNSNPKIVILTPGPFNEGYYEHNLLARYLGFTLVRGSDLTVRNFKVYLKTIEGLQRVHVIIRRQLDSYCDPLELKHDSLLGIPGLVQSQRVGNIKILNPLGSGLINDPIFMHFFEKICKYYTTEKPEISVVESNWLKNKDHLNKFLKNHNDYTVKTCLSDGHFIYNPTTMPEEDRLSLFAKIKDKPQCFIACKKIKGVESPSFKDQEVKSETFSLRTFFCLHENKYKILDGALCLSENSELPGLLSIQSNHLSKDTWIISEKQPDQISLLNTYKVKLPIKRSSSDMPSSVIDNLLWFSRYMERVEGKLRILNSIFSSIINDADYDKDILNQLIRALTPDTLIDLDFKRNHLDLFLNKVLTSTTQENSLRFLLDRAIENASVSRSRISADTWKLLSTIRTMLIEQPSFVGQPEAYKFINEMMNLLSAFHGLCAENMTHEPGWRFLDAGIRIERIVHLSHLISSLIVYSKDEESERMGMKKLLEVADSNMTYNSRYFSSLQLVPVLDLLIADETNPRSIYFQLIRLNEHFEKLPGNKLYPKNSEQKIMSSILNDFYQIDFNKLLEVDECGVKSNLSDYLRSLVDSLFTLSDSITRTYLSHVYDKTQITYSE